MTTKKQKSNSSYKDAAMTILLSGEALKHKISTAPLPICGLEVCSFWRLPHASWESMSDHLDPTNSRSVGKLLLETIILSTSMEKIRINLTDCRSMNQDPTRTPPSVFWVLEKSCFGKHCKPWELLRWPSNKSGFGKGAVFNDHRWSC